MLNHIEVRNFKSLKYLNYKCAQLNLLTGVNGAGKSSFVQLLLFLRSLAGRVKDLSVKIPLASISDGSEVLSYDDLKYCYASPKDPIAFSVDFSIAGTNRVFFSLFDDDSSGRVSRIITKNQNDHVVTIINPEAIRIDEDFKREAGDFVFFHSFSDEWGDWIPMSKDDAEEGSVNPRYKQIEDRRNAQIKELKEHEAKKVSVYDLLFGNLKMVSAFRERPHAVHMGGHFSNGINLEGVTFNPEGSDIIEFISKYGTTKILDKGNPMIFPDGSLWDDASPVPCNKTTLLEQLQLWISVVSPDAKIFTESVKVGESERVVMSVGFGDDGKGMRKFKPQNVGFGISYVLPVLVTLLMSKPGDIVIIENPEAHLHPRGQSAMGNLLARAAAYGIQLFVETHSDHVIGGIQIAVKNGLIKHDDVNVAFFERKEHKMDDESIEIFTDVRNIKIDSNGSLSEYPVDFLDEWNRQMKELMKP